MKRVLFACVRNAGRSQMAAAWLNALADPSIASAVSAGTVPGSVVHPEVVDVMREVGIDLSGVVPRRLTREAAAAANLLVTMGCGEECPFVPGLEREDWPLEDPAGQPIARVREIRDEIRSKVVDLLARRYSPAPTLEPAKAFDRDAILDLLRMEGLPFEGVAGAEERFLVLRRAGEVIGVCGLEAHGPDALLRSLVVDPLHRGGRLGDRLLDESLARARQRGFRDLYLLTTTALGFFAARGFVACARDSAPAAIRDSWEFRTGCPATARLMRRTL